MRVRRIPRAHLLDGGGEEPAVLRKMSVSSAKKQKIKPGQEVVEIFAAGRRVPVRVFLEQLDVEAVEAARGLDVEGVFADLLDRGDAGQRQEEAEVVVKVGVGAGDRLAIDEVFRFEAFAVGGQDELGLLAGGGGTLPQRGEGSRHFAFRADLECGCCCAGAPRRADPIGSCFHS